MRSAAAPASVTLPTHLEVVQTLHAGDERSVQRVRDRSSGETSVLKLAGPNAAEETIRGLEQEFLLLERIDHPHLVHVSQFLHLRDGSRGFLMEDLEQEPGRGHATPGWTPRDPEAVRSVLGALRCLHAIGYAHLDLKPSQVLRGPRGAVLVDLGLAARISSTLVARGTWGYIAPELLKGGEWDRRADIYQVGCLLVAVWTGEAPHGGGEVAEQIRRQLKRPRLKLREHIPCLPEGLDLVVEAFLDPDPAERPGDAQKAWESIHTLAGSRERYLERKRLPVPSSIPLVAMDGVESDWDESLRHGGPDAWVVEGPVGSGRHRLLRRLQARAEVLGAECSVHGGILDVVLPGKNGSRARRATCRVGQARKGERTINLGPVGEEQARAALEAYGLEGEGREAEWTLAILQARLDERVGGEESRRRSGRIRRSLAAACGAQLAIADRVRLAEAIAAIAPEERPSAVSDDRLVQAGYVRLEPDGRLTPAAPPWDTESLRALLDDGDVTAAHRRLLELSGTDSVVQARHALDARDVKATAFSLGRAAELLRQRGDVAAAADLLARGRALLGASFPPDWLTLQAALALEDGAPVRCFPLLQGVGESSGLPAEWTTLLRAHLDNRAGRRDEAIRGAQPLLAHAESAAVRRAAAAIVVRALLARGDLAEATGLGLPFLAGSSDEVPAAEKLRLATLLFNALRLQGLWPEECAKIRKLLEKGLAGSGLRERMVSASSLGLDAFQRGEFDQAQSLFEIAHDAAVAAGDAMTIAGARANLGGVYFEAGRLAECEDLNRLALSAYDELGMKSNAAVTRRNLAAVLQQAGRWGESLDLSRASREELESLGAQDEADSALGLEAGLLLDLGLFEAGAKALDQCDERLARLPQPIVEAILRRDRGRIERAMGRCEEARRQWEGSIEAARAVEAADEERRTLLERAAAELAWGNLSGANEFRERAESGARAPGTGELGIRRAFLDAAFDIHTKRESATRSAEGRLAEAAEMAARCGVRPWTWRCHAGRAGVAAQAGDDASARAATRMALDALRELLAAIATPALQESYVMLPDPRLFLSWCEGGGAVGPEIVPGSSDLEVFLR